MVHLADFLQNATHRKVLLKVRTASLGQVSSVQSLDRLSRRGDMRNDSAEIIFLREAIVSSSGMLHKKENTVVYCVHRCSRLRFPIFACERGRSDTHHRFIT